MELWAHQTDALTELHNGSVLVGGTGSGKSRTALAYYNKVLDGREVSSKTLYVITTAKKRDDGDWGREAGIMGVDSLVVDSWNNIKKYTKVKDSFFIFDEQRVVGYGVWTKSFLKIARKNLWILLSATPADVWTDLIPVFIANGFYKNKTEFNRLHVIFAPYVRYPKIIGYQNEKLLTAYKNRVFTIMEDQRHTVQHILKVPVEYNEELVKEVLRTQWNPFGNKPVDNLMQEVYILRRIINSHPSRVLALLEIQEIAKRLIIFYNFNFELEILKTWFGYRTLVAEHNGHRHDPLPEGDSWAYLVQYNSGSEAWECFTTNHMAFYSLNYSYRSRHQARGRIDRHNTLFTDLYYYELVSDSFLDKAILTAFEGKKNFNIRMLKLPRISQVL